MKVLPVANAMVVLIVMIARVSISNQEIRRPVAARHVIAPVIQTRAAIIAGCTPSTTTVVAKSTAGAITAVARVAATRVMISRRCGGASTSGVGAGAASARCAATRSPRPRPRGRLVDVHRERRSGSLFVLESSAPPGYVGHPRPAGGCRKPAASTALLTRHPGLGWLAVHLDRGVAPEAEQVLDRQRVVQRVGVEPRD